ncbi:MAG: c-type cytochrome [Silvanigrellaceae bacterium]
MRLVNAIFLLCIGVATGCSTAAPVPDQLTKKPGPTDTTTTTSSDKPQGGGAVGAAPSSSNSTPANNNSSTNSSATTTAAFTLDEAKAKCASCHQPGGSGASVWSKANGTEADWKTFAGSAKLSVNADRMPPPNGLAGQDKTKMIAFLDKLLGMSAGSGTTTPQPVVFNFDNARALCIGCHAKGGKSPRLETTAQWALNKGEIKSEVQSGSMPKGKTLTTEERAALLKYIKSL